MSDNEVLQMLLDVKEIQVDGFEVQDLRFIFTVVLFLKSRFVLIV